MFIFLDKHELNISESNDLKWCSWCWNLEDSVTGSSNHLFFGSLLSSVAIFLPLSKTSSTSEEGNWVSHHVWWGNMLHADIASTQQSKLASVNSDCWRLWSVKHCWWSRGLHHSDIVLGKKSQDNQEAFSDIDPKFRLWWSVSILYSKEVKTKTAHQGICHWFVASIKTWSLRLVSLPWL